MDIVMTYSNAIGVQRRLMADPKSTYLWTEHQTILKGAPYGECMSVHSFICLICG